MKRLILHTISSIILLVYITGSVGFGLHICSNDGSSKLLLLSSKTSCKEIHEECSCTSNHCSSSHHKHGHGCCKTEMHHLDMDYDIIEVLDSLPLYLTDAFLVASLHTTLLIPDSLVGYQYVEFKHGPGGLLTDNILPVISQWRL